MKKFWLFITSILSAVLVVIGFSACAPKQVTEEQTIESVTISNLRATYKTTDAIPLNNVRINVKFKDETEVQTLTHGEFDIEKENAKEETEFILYTNGLSAQIAGELEKGRYQIFVYLVEYNATYNLMNLTVTEEEVPEAQITSVTLNHLNASYFSTDTIAFNAITVTVAYDDNTTDELTHGEFDVAKTDIKVATEFVLDTHNLSKQTAGQYAAGTYQISVYLVGADVNYENKMTVTIASPTITGVVVNNLNAEYNSSDTINFAGVTVTVTYNNNASVTLTHGEFDVVEKTQNTTEFILDTDGLAKQIAGQYVTGTYQISVYLVGADVRRENVKTVAITSLSEKYDFISYANPAFVTTYNTNKNNAGKSTDDVDYESSFFKADDGYFVGDDNEFIFKPILTVIAKDAEDEYAYETPEKFNVVVKVNDQTIVEGEQYEDFRYENFKFYFTSNAIWTEQNNKIFKIEMLPADFSGNNITAATLTVKVADGYNVYDEKDLGRMCLVSNDFKKNNNHTTYERWKSWTSFYNDYTQDFKSVLYYDLWRDYLTAEGKTDLAPVNGIFIHKDLIITPDTIPSEYIISEEENAYAAGSLRDRAVIFAHYLEGDFTFNGNLFKIDFSKIKYGLCNSDKGGFYYTEGHSDYYMGHSNAFAFIGKENNTTLDVVTFKNAEFFGNKNYLDEGVVWGELTEAEQKDIFLQGSGSLILINAVCSNVDVYNCISKNCFISWYSELNKVVTFTDSNGDQQTSANGLDVNYCKTYDNYNSAMFAWNGENNTLRNSELRRFGAPAIFLINSTSDGDKVGAAEWKIYDSIIESFIDGTEGWFSITPGAGDIATALKGFNYAISLSGKTILNPDVNDVDNYGKINLLAAALEADLMGSKEKYLFNYLIDGEVNENNYPLEMNNSEFNMINQLLETTNYTPPIFLSNGGTAAYFDGSQMQYLYDATSFAGNKLIIIIPHDKTLIVAVVEIF